MKKVLLAICALGAAVAAVAQIPSDPAARKRMQEIGFAEYYVKEFENEVARQRGGDKWVWRNKNTALQKVQDLKLKYPDDPRVEALFQRTKIALKKSKGEYTEVSADWTAYLHNEENLRKLISAAGEKEWKQFLEQHRAKVLTKNYPTPDSAKVTVDDLRGTYVVLDDVEYPHHQFYGATGEFVACGKPSSGFWFVDIAGRDWLGPYEAVKRYRRNVDSSMTEVKPMSAARFTWSRVLA